MRYSEAHAARSGSVPFALRGPKSVRMALATAVAGAIGLVPAVAVSTPAFAMDGLTVTPASGSVTEGSDVTYTVKNTTDGTISDITVTVTPSGDDPIASSGDVTFTPSSSFDLAAGASKTVTVRAVDDALFEPTETFTVSATPEGEDATTAAGKIYDNDNEPSYTLTASPSTVTEKASADTTTKVTAQLSAKSGVDTKIVLTGEDGTAKVTDDYTLPTSEDDRTITIPAGSLTSTSSYVTVTIKGDGVRDTAATETFKVNGAADNATPSEQSATISIVDAQSMPTLTLAQNHDSGAEGTDITYTVTADPESELPITVRWDVVDVVPEEGDDKATSGQDFSYPSTRTLTIPAGGDGTAAFTLPLKDDGLNENSEQFGVQLVAPTNAVLDEKNSKVVTTITDANAEQIPSVAITPTTVTEGNAGKSPKTFTATLSQKSGRTVTVEWSTVVPESIAAATPGKDYITKKGTLVFPAGTLTQTFTVDVVGDIVNEGDETFSIALASANETADWESDDDKSTAITITDDDLPPTVALDSVTMKEGEVTAPVMLQVKLSNPSTHDIRFDVAADSASGPGYASGTYDEDTPGSGDYTLLVSGDKAVTIRAGQTVGYIPLLVNGDTMFEPDETADITATVDSADTDYVSATTQSKTSTLKLTNEDKAPMLVIDDVDASEGDTADITGTVEGTADSDMSFDITFAGGSNKGSTAAATTDFVNPGILTGTIPAGTEPGDSVSIGSVSIVDDTTSEGAETIKVSGVPQAGSMGTVTPGWVTIAASDGGQNVAPTLNLAEMVTGGINTPITGKAGANAMVELWGAPISASNAPLTKLAETKANGAGAFSFTRTLSSGYRFKIASGGAMSPEKKVTVTQDPVFVVSSPSKGTVSLAVQGTPRGVGQTVLIQAWVGGKWTNVKGWTGTTASNNQWRATGKYDSGSVSFRAFVQGYTPNGIMGGYSDTKKITVK